MTMDRLNNRIRLPDGRLLGYAEYGDPAGKPVFFFHGWPSSRLAARPIDEPAARGARVIAIDRPGIGLSDFKPGRTIGEWPDDVVAVADRLGIDRFAVAGASGGGPYAAVCALKIPERLTIAALISGVAPIEMPGAAAILGQRSQMLFRLARRAPWILRLPLALRVRRARRDPERFLLEWTATMPETDRATLLGPAGIGRQLIEDYIEAFRAGTCGLAWEAGLYMRPWGFRLEEITMEVHLWQGEKDVHIPPAMGRYQASVIPRCRATFWANESHFSLTFSRMDEIVATLISSEPVAVS
ncbi:MAG TPA: alpha/beta hydrolase [Chloroflexi bacterium]|nr:alpha/beta hydrolase [Chloroflexota bacterium]